MIIKRKTLQKTRIKHLRRQSDVNEDNQEPGNIVFRIKFQNWNRHLLSLLFINSNIGEASSNFFAPFKLLHSTFRNPGSQQRCCGNSVFKDFFVVNANRNTKAMNTLKAISATAFVIIIALVVILINLQKPIEKQYLTTIHALMSMKGYDSESTLLDAYPELVAIRAELQHIEQLKYHCKSLIYNPIPPSKLEESKILNLKRKALRDSQENIKNRLDQILLEAKEELAQL